MLTTALIVSGACAVPTALWGRERSLRRRDELAYNIRVAQSLGHAATLRDHETGAHNYRVTYLTSLFATDLGLMGKDIRSLMKGAFLHDVGKIGIPDSILCKEGPLSAPESAIMREHPVMGVGLLADMPWFADAVPVVRHHHERYDGTGYPFGLAGSATPLAARIFAVIDVFDALLAARPYKRSFSLEKTLGIIETEISSHFDPDLCARFLRHATDYAAAVIDRDEAQLKNMLETRRQRIFGL
jgi:HD-GYP domain-containing protein (c-di-GMP phosphodiesterase class II)